MTRAVIAEWLVLCVESREDGRLNPVMGRFLFFLFCLSWDVFFFSMFVKFPVSLVVVI